MLGLLDDTSIATDVSSAELASVVSRLAVRPNPTGADPVGRAQNVDRIDRIAVLEQLKSACAAAQAHLSADLLSNRLADERAATETTRRGFDPDQVRRGVAAEIGFARHQSPARARRMLGLAQALTTEMPCVLAALADGTTSEYRAQLIAQEFGCLSSQDRIAADREIGPKLAGLGDARSRHAAAGIAGRLDPAAVLAKIRGAVSDRRVSIRPAPDTMLRLSALLPLTSGMAAFFALCRCADLGRAEGDERSRDQFMADELVARLNIPPAGVANNPPAGEANGIKDVFNPPTHLPVRPTESKASTTPPTDPPAGVADPAVPSPSAISGSGSGSAGTTGPTEQTGCDAYGAPNGPGGAIDLQLMNPPAGVANGSSTVTTNLPGSPGTGRSPPSWPDTSSRQPPASAAGTAGNSRPAPRKRSSGGCSPTPTPADWSRWTPAPGNSPMRPAGS